MDWNQYPDSLGGKSDNTADGQVVQEERREPTYYARIPLMAQLELTPYELALYTNYKQTCAEFGRSWKSNQTLANETHMSVSTVKEARRSLSDKGYIKVVYITAPDVNHSLPPTVTVVDVWESNHTLGETLRGGRQKTTPSRQKTTPSRQKTANKNSGLRKGSNDSKRGAKAPARNLHFDELVKLFGVDYERMTKSEKTAYGKVANELKAAGVQPDEMCSLHAYVSKLAQDQKWNGFTIHALAAHNSNWRRSQSGGNKPNPMQGLKPL